ncbi:hypothetical protein HDV00_012326 [Rhizophlyctis rosea]|nr:hypothetical protein HDV00_012326 [Rhizophlyctis rosea]
MVEYLLSVGADPNGGWGAGLKAAAQTGNVRIVTLFLDQGADVNAYDGRTIAIGVAAKHGHLHIVKLLVDRKADLNMGRVHETETALFHAVDRQDVEMVQYLLDAGADATVRNTETLIEAIKGGHLSMVPTLLDAPINVEVRKGKAVYLAAAAGYTDVVRQLVEVAPGADDEEGFEQFMKGVDRGVTVAARKGYDEIVDLLLEASGDRYELLFIKGAEKLKSRK